MSKFFFSKWRVLVEYCGACVRVMLLTVKALAAFPSVYPSIFEFRNTVNFRFSSEEPHRHAKRLSIASDAHFVLQ